MRLAGFKSFLSQLLDRLEVDATVFTDYIVGLLEVQDNSTVAISITEWLNAITQQTMSNGTDHRSIAEDIRRKYQSVRGEDSYDDDDDDACIEDYLREQGPDVDLGSDCYDTEEYDAGDLALGEKEYHDTWVKDYNGTEQKSCTEGWQDGYNNDWTEEEIRAWEEQEAYNQQHGGGEYQSFDYEGATGYDYSLSDGASYDYGINNGVDEAHLEVIALVTNVKDCLLPTYPTMVFSDEAIYSVLSDSSGDTERAARSIEKAYNEASVCKPCRYMMTGKCYKRDCIFQHEVAGVTCRFWLLDPGCAALSADEGGTCPFQHKVFPLAPPRETEIETIYRAVSESQREAERAVISASDFPALPPITVSSTNSSKGTSSAVRYANAARGDASNGLVR